MPSDAVNVRAWKMPIKQISHEIKQLRVALSTLQFPYKSMTILFSLLTCILKSTILTPIEVTPSCAYFMEIPSFVE